VLREGVAIVAGVEVVVVGRKKERASAKDIITKRARQRASAFGLRTCISADSLFGGVITCGEYLN
jgi:hypothetical protein